MGRLADCKGWRAEHADDRLQIGGVDHECVPDDPAVRDQRVHGADVRRDQPHDEPGADDPGVAAWGSGADKQQQPAPADRREQLQYDERRPLCDDQRRGERPGADGAGRERGDGGRWHGAVQRPECVGECAVPWLFADVGAVHAARDEQRERRARCEAAGVVVGTCRLGGGARVHGCQRDATGDDVVAAERGGGAGDGDDRARVGRRDAPVDDCAARSAYNATTRIAVCCPAQMALNAFVLDNSTHSGNSSISLLRSDFRMEPDYRSNLPNPHAYFGTTGAVRVSGASSVLRILKMTWAMSMRVFVAGSRFNADGHILTGHQFRLEQGASLRAEDNVASAVWFSHHCTIRLTHGVYATDISARVTNNTILFDSTEGLSVKQISSNHEPTRNGLLLMHNFYGSRGVRNPFEDVVGTCAEMLGPWDTIFCGNSVIHTSSSAMFEIVVLDDHPVVGADSRIEHNAARFSADSPSLTFTWLAAVTFAGGTFRHNDVSCDYVRNLYYHPFGVLPAEAYHLLVAGNVVNAYREPRWVTDVLTTGWCVPEAAICNNTCTVTHADTITLHWLTWSWITHRRGNFTVVRNAVNIFRIPTVSLAVMTINFVVGQQERLVIANNTFLVVGVTDSTVTLVVLSAGEAANITATSNRIMVNVPVENQRNAEVEAACEYHSTQVICNNSFLLTGSLKTFTARLFIWKWHNRPATLPSAHRLLILKNTVTVLGVQSVTVSLVDAGEVHRPLVVVANRVVITAALSVVCYLLENAGVVSTPLEVSHNRVTNRNSTMPPAVVPEHNDADDCGYRHRSVSTVCRNTIDATSTRNTMTIIIAGGVRVQSPSATLPTTTVVVQSNVLSINDVPEVFVLLVALAVLNSNTAARVLDNYVACSNTTKSFRVLPFIRIETASGQSFVEGNVVLVTGSDVAASERPSGWCAHLADPATTVVCNNTVLCTACGGAVEFTWMDTAAVTAGASELTVTNNSFRASWIPTVVYFAFSNISAPSGRIRITHNYAAIEHATVLCRVVLASGVVLQPLTSAAALCLCVQQNAVSIVVSAAGGADVAAPCVESENATVLVCRNVVDVVLHASIVMSRLDVLIVGEITALLPSNATARVWWNSIQLAATYPDLLSVAVATVVANYTTTNAATVGLFDGNDFTATNIRAVNYTPFYNISLRAVNPADGECSGCGSGPTTHITRNRALVSNVTQVFVTLIQRATAARVAVVNNSITSTSAPATLDKDARPEAEERDVLRDAELVVSSNDVIVDFNVTHANGMTVDVVLASDINASLWNASTLLSVAFTRVSVVLTGGVSSVSSLRLVLIRRTSASNHVLFREYGASNNSVRFDCAARSEGSAANASGGSVAITMIESAAKDRLDEVALRVQDNTVHGVVRSGPWSVSVQLLRAEGVANSTLAVANNSVAVEDYVTGGAGGVTVRVGAVEVGRWWRLPRRVSQLNVSGVGAGNWSLVEVEHNQTLVLEVADTSLSCGAASACSAVLVSLGPGSEMDGVSAVSCVVTADGGALNTVLVGINASGAAVRRLELRGVNLTVNEGVVRSTVHGVAAGRRPTTVVAERCVVAVSSRESSGALCTVEFALGDADRVLVVNNTNSASTAQLEDADSDEAPSGGPNGPQHTFVAVANNVVMGQPGASPARLFALFRAAEVTVNTSVVVANNRFVSAAGLLHVRVARNASRPVLPSYAVVLTDNVAPSSFMIVDGVVGLAAVLTINVSGCAIGTLRVTAAAGNSSAGDRGGGACRVSVAVVNATVSRVVVVGVPEVADVDARMQDAVCALDPLDAYSNDCDGAGCLSLVGAANIRNLSVAAERVALGSSSHDDSLTQRLRSAPAALLRVAGSGTVQRVAVSARDVVGDVRRVLLNVTAVGRVGAVEVVVNDSVLRAAPAGLLALSRTASVSSVDVCVHRSDVLNVNASVVSLDVGASTVQVVIVFAVCRLSGHAAAVTGAAAVQVAGRGAAVRRNDSSILFDTVAVDGYDAVLALPAARDASTVSGGLSSARSVTRSWTAAEHAAFENVSVLLESACTWWNHTLPWFPASALPGLSAIRDYAVLCRSRLTGRACRCHLTSQTRSLSVPLPPTPTASGSSNATRSASVVATPSQSSTCQRRTVSPEVTPGTLTRSESSAPGSASRTASPFGTVSATESVSQLSPTLKLSASTSNSASRSRWTPAATATVSRDRRGASATVQLVTASVSASGNETATANTSRTMPTVTLTLTGNGSSRSVAWTTASVSVTASLRPPRHEALGAAPSLRAAAAMLVAAAQATLLSAATVVPTAPMALQVSQLSSRVVRLQRLRCGEERAGAAGVRVDVDVDAGLSVVDSPTTLELGTASLPRAAGAVVGNTLLLVAVPAAVAAAWWVLRAATACRPSTSASGSGPYSGSPTPESGGGGTPLAAREAGSRMRVVRVFVVAYFFLQVPTLTASVMLFAAASEESAAVDAVAAAVGAAVCFAVAAVVVGVYLARRPFKRRRVIAELQHADSGCAARVLSAMSALTRQRCAWQRLAKASRRGCWVWVLEVFDELLSGVSSPHAWVVVADCASGVVYGVLVGVLCVPSIDCGSAEAVIWAEVCVALLVAVCELWLRPRTTLLDCATTLVATWATFVSLLLTAVAPYVDFAGSGAEAVLSAQSALSVLLCLCELACTLEFDWLFSACMPGIRSRSANVNVSAHDILRMHSSELHDDVCLHANGEVRIALPSGAGAPSVFDEERHKVLAALIDIVCKRQAVVVPMGCTASPSALKVAFV